MTPGTYQVRLRVGTQQWEQALEVRADPRLQVSAAALAVQLKLARQLADALDRSTSALFEARSLRAQSQERAAHANAELAGPLRAFDGELAALLKPAGDHPQAQARRGLEALNGDFATLYEQVNRADVAPTEAQTAATAQAAADWQALETPWQALRGAKADALNARLAGAQLAPLQPQREPPEDLDMADLE